MRARINRDDRYLARRLWQQRHTRYDKQVMTNLYAFALAIALLEQSSSSNQGFATDANHS